MKIYEGTNLAQELANYVFCGKANSVAEFEEALYTMHPGVNTNAWQELISKLPEFMLPDAMIRLGKIYKNPEYFLKRNVIPEKEILDFFQATEKILPEIPFVSYEKSVDLLENVTLNQISKVGANTDYRHVLSFLYKNREEYTYQKATYQHILKNIILILGSEYWLWHTVYDSLNIWAKR